MYTCLRVYGVVCILVYECVCEYPQKSEEGIRSPEAGFWAVVETGFYCTEVPPSCILT